MLVFAKKYVSLLMLVLMFFHGSLELFILKIFQAQHREEINKLIDEDLSEDELVLFNFSKDNFEKGLKHIEWVEEHEFRIEGEMYDIVRKEITSDSVYLYCYHDKKESKLYSGILKIFDRLPGNEASNTRNLAVINNLLSEFYFSTSIEINVFCIEESNCYLPVKIFDLLEGEHFIDLPPPRS
jgi:hypothetical protein